MFEPAIRLRGGNKDAIRKGSKMGAERDRRMRRRRKRHLDQMDKVKFAQIYCVKV